MLEQVLREGGGQESDDDDDDDEGAFFFLHSFALLSIWSISREISYVAHGKQDIGNGPAVHGQWTLDVDDQVDSSRRCVMLPKFPVKTHTTCQNFGLVCKEAKTIGCWP
jgi:hypothetical protein